MNQRKATLIYLSFSHFITKNLCANRITCFTYHVISEQHLPHLSHLYAYKTANAFEQDLIFLSKNFQVISYEQLFAHLKHQRPLPERPALISIDDGYAECYTHFRPLLLQYKMPCIFFLVANFLDNQSMFYRNKISLCIEQILKMDVEDVAVFAKELLVDMDKKTPIKSKLINWLKGLSQEDQTLIDTICQTLEVDVEGYLNKQKPYLTSNQVTELLADGFTIGAHTLNHPRLQKLSETELNKEVIESCRILDTQYDLNSNIPFAFPFSGVGISSKIISQLLNHNEIGLIFDSQGITDTNHIRVNRILVDRPLTKGVHSDLGLHYLSAFMKMTIYKYFIFGRTLWKQN